LTRYTVTNAGALGDTYAWLPDGSKIVIALGAALDGSNAFNGVLNIWAVNADGSGAVPLTTLTAPGADSVEPNLP